MSDSLFHINIKASEVLAKIEAIHNELQNKELTEFDVETLQADIAVLYEELNTLYNNRNDKLRDCWFWDKSKNAELAMLESFFSYYQARVRATKAHIESHRNYVAMNLAPGEKYDDAPRSPAKYSWLKSIAAVQTGDINQTPDAYRRHKWEPAKDLIKSDLKSGAEIPGWKLEERQNLQVK